jgi:hypothetical protein
MNYARLSSFIEKMKRKYFTEKMKIIAAPPGINACAILYTTVILTII